MSFQENVLGFVHLGRESADPARIRMQLLDERTMGSTDRLFPRPRIKAQDLVRLLFRHRARSRRAGLPRVAVSISVFCPSGRSAVQISL